MIKKVYSKLPKSIQYAAKMYIRRYSVPYPLRKDYKNVPSYYKRVFDEMGLKPKDIQDFKDLQQLPFLAKQIILNLEYYSNPLKEQEGLR